MSRRKKEVYPSDLSDEQWSVAGAVLRAAIGRSGRVSRREILNAIFYVHRTGCQWRYLLPMALLAQELSTLENRLFVFLALAAQRGVGQGARSVACRSALRTRPHRYCHSSHCRFSKHQEHRKRGPRGYDGAKMEPSR